MLCVKFIHVVLKNYSTKSWLENVMRKSYKYRKNCAEKLSFKVMLKINII